MSDGKGAVRDDFYASLIRAASRGRAGDGDELPAIAQNKIDDGSVLPAIAVRWRLRALVGGPRSF
jgi:hypothetical protein